MARLQEQSRTSKPSDAQIAWAAGLFEGEGFTVRRPVGKRIYMQLGVETRDLDVLGRFVDVLRGCGIQPEERPSGPRKLAAISLRPRNSSNPNHSDIYRWVTTGNTGRRAYELLRPYLGERRRAKADAILNEIDELLRGLESVRACKECGTTFELRAYGRARQFCSALCHSRWKIRQPGNREAARERNRRYRERKRSRSDATGR